MALGKGLQSLIPPKGESPERDNADRNSVAPRNSFIPDERKTVVRPREHRDFSEKESSQKQEAIFHIEVEKIRPNPYQPRREFREEELMELAQSIKEFGVIQPLVVSKITRETESGADVEYQLIAGERRLKAAKMVGLERIPAIVRRIDAGKTKLEIALIENIQRSDLNALESARAYARLQDEFGLTQREVAARVGKSRESIANTLRLLNLPEEIQNALLGNKINESQARTLLSISNQAEQMRAFRNLVSEKLSVRELRQKTDSAGETDPEQRFWERKLEEKYQTPIRIKKKGGRGKILIPFYSNEEMNALVERLLGESDF